MESSPSLPQVPQGRLLSAATSDDRPLEALLAHVRCEVKRAGCWLPVPADWSLDVPGPLNYTLWLCVGGWAEYHLGDQPYELSAGRLILAPPHLRRRGRHDPANPLHLYTVHFTARLHGVLDMPAVCQLPTTLLPQPEVFRLMTRAAHRIVTELAVAAPGYALAVNGTCAHLLSLLWREAVAQGATRVAAGEPAGPLLTHLGRLMPVLRLIETRFAEPLALNDLAAAAHLHPAYFSTVFRKSVGVSPLRYLARYRLDRARELLLSSDLAVKTIALQVGFPDPTYFNRIFRRAVGMPPTQYRESKGSPSFS